MTPEDMSRVRSLIPAIKDAWGLEHIELTSEALHVHVPADHVMRFPTLLHSIPVEVNVLDSDERPWEAAA